MSKANTAFGSNIVELNIFLCIYNDLLLPVLRCSHTVVYKTNEQYESEKQYMYISEYMTARFITNITLPSSTKSDL